MHQKSIYLYIAYFINDVVKPRNGEIPEILGNKWYQNQFSDKLVTPYKGNTMDLVKCQNST